MTIKQHGGIFGRNPTFNDVTITDIEVTGTSNLTGNVGIGTTPSTEALTVAGKITSTTSGYTVNSTYPLFGYYNVGPVGYVQAPVAGNFEVWADSTGAIAKFKDNLDVEIVSGNLVIGTSGNGIDFSATSDPSSPSAATSELLDDYEEGTFIPEFQATSGSFTSVTHDVQSGTYTKIGNVVTIDIRIRTDAINTTGGTGLQIGGLPYAEGGSGGGLAIGFFGDWATDPFTAKPVNNAIYMYSSTGTSITHTALNTGTNDNELHIGGSYIAS